jgi:hypothetical protein
MLDRRESGVLLDGWANGGNYQTLLCLGTLFTIALLFPELKFKLYEVHGGGKDVEGTWAVAHSVLIQERELPKPNCQKFCVYWVELSW